jgi:hypothetical protein
VTWAWSERLICTVDSENTRNNTYAVQWGTGHRAPVVCTVLHLVGTALDRSQGSSLQPPWGLVCFATVGSYPRWLINCMMYCIGLWKKRSCPNRGGGGYPSCMQSSSVRAANSSQNIQRAGNVTGDHTVRSWSDAECDTNFGLLE